MNVALLSQPQRELRAYLQRVAGDGGIVETPGEASTFVRRLRSAGVLGSTVIAGVAGGVKAGTLYSIIGPDLDVTRGTVKNRVNRAGVLSEVASGVPATDFAGGVLRGTTVEPSSRNEIRNNTMQGAVVGSPGTLPTNWVEALAGLTRQVVGVGVADGVDYIDIRLSGTASGGGASIRFETNTGITASSAQAWTNSFWFSVIAQPIPANTYRFEVNERTDAGSFVTNNFTAITNPTIYERKSNTYTLVGGATVARVQPGINFNITSGQSYDFTVRIGLPQMELGSVATSVIKTTGSAQTRNADVITKTGLGSVLPQTEGWVYAEVDVRLNTAPAKIALQLHDGSATNLIDLRFNSASSILLLAQSGLSPQRAITSTTNRQGVLKILGVFNNGTLSLFINGVNIGTRSDFGLFSAPLGFIELGRDRGAGATTYLNDPIHSYAIGSGPITDAQAIQLTTL
jgi:hypothetical protein